VVPQPDGEDDSEDWQGGAPHADGQSGDDIGGRSGFGGFGDGADGWAAGVVFGQQSDGDAGETARQDPPKNPRVQLQSACQPVRAGHHQSRRNEGGIPKCCPWVYVLEDAYASHPDQGGHQADHDDEEGVLHGRHSRLGLSYARRQSAENGCRRRRGDGDSGNDGTDVGLENVGAHAGHITDIVAYIVGDGGGIAGIVLRNALLDLAHQIGPDIG